MSVAALSISAVSHPFSAGSAGMETPLLRAKRNLFLKMEAFNPGGSHKSRAARFVIEDAVRRKLVVPHGRRRILEKSGGNFGVGLAYAATPYGIGVDLVVGLHFSPIKKALCVEYGARLVGEHLLKQGLTSRQTVEQLLAEHPDDYHFTDQFANPNNLRAHLETTGPEIVRQLQAAGVDKAAPVILVKTAGTGASYRGIADNLLNGFSEVRLCLVEPEGSDFVNDIAVEHPFDGAFVGERPPFIDPSMIDERRWISAAAAFGGQRRLACDIGFFPGVTSGANYAVAAEIAESAPEAVVVTVVYDYGDAYLHRVAA